MRPNRLRQLLNEGKPTIGTHVISPWPSIVEIVGQKTRAVYAALLQRHAIDPARFLMVGNSLRSDIQPVLALGGQAEYIPYINTWAHEHRVSGISHLRVARGAP